MIDCSKMANYFAEKQRMVKQQISGVVCGISCEECPLSSINNGKGIVCSDFETCYLEKAIELVQKWSDEHPPKTYLTDFLKHYPNVQLYDTGIPKGVCPYHLGLMNKDDCRKDRDCVKCWNQPIPIEDGEE